jgi:hypothetical protein
MSHGLGARARLQLAQDALGVRFDGLRGDSQRPSNTFIGHAAGNHSKNADLAA